LTFVYQRIPSFKPFYPVLIVRLALFNVRALLIANVLSLHVALLSFTHVPLSLFNVEALFAFATSFLSLALISLVLASLEEFTPSLLSFSKAQHPVPAFISTVIVLHLITSSFTLLRISNALELLY